MNRSVEVSRGVWPRPSLSQLSASSAHEVKGCSTQVNMSGEKSITQQHLSNDICARCVLYLFWSILKQHLNYYPEGSFLWRGTVLWVFGSAASILKNDTFHEDLIAHRSMTNGSCSSWMQKHITVILLLSTGIWHSATLSFLGVR